MADEEANWWSNIRKWLATGVRSLATVNALKIFTFGDAWTTLVIVGCVIIVGFCAFLLLAPIVFVFIGWINLSACPRQPFIPFCVALDALLLGFFLFCQKSCGKETVRMEAFGHEDDVVVNTSPWRRRVDKRMPQLQILLMMAGFYCIISIAGDFQGDDPEVPDYCSPLFYGLAYYYIIIRLLCIVCCHICAPFVGKFLVDVFIGFAQGLQLHDQQRRQGQQGEEAPVQIDNMLQAADYINVNYVRRVN